MYKKDGLQSIRFFKKWFEIGIGEGVVVDGDAADQPAEGVVVAAEPGQGAGGADALEGGVQPQGDADPRVDGGVARAALAGADASRKGAEVQAQAEVPDDAGLVVGLEQVLQGHGRDDLLTVRHPQPRGRSVAHDRPCFNAAGCCPLYTYGTTFDSQPLRACSIAA